GGERTGDGRGRARGTLQEGQLVLRREGGGTAMARKPRKRATRRWVRTVTTDSTHPPPRTFTGSAERIARTMARKDVSPKGLGSGVRMIQYFINRAGTSLPETRRREPGQANRHS